MTVVAPPPHDELELLIREARARQRKRWLGTVALVAVLAGAAVAAYSVAAARPHRASHSGSTPAAALPSCRAQQLAISYVRKGAVMGEEGGLLRFTNMDGNTCRISGWPTVTAVTGYGRSVAAARIVRAPMLFATYWVDGPRVPSLTLARNRSAYAILGGFDNPIGRPARWRCPTARRLLVGPPGSRRTVVLSGFLWENGDQPLYLPLCDGGRPFLSPVLPRPALAH